MSRMSEKFEVESQHKLELEMARAESIHDALPESLLESHELIRSLQCQVTELITQIKSPWPKWLERIWGFVLGLIASLVASAIWSR